MTFLLRCLMPLVALGPLRPVGGVWLHSSLRFARPVVLLQPLHLPCHSAVPAAHRPDGHDDLHLHHHRPQLRTLCSNRLYLPTQGQRIHHRRKLLVWFALVCSNLDLMAPFLLINRLYVLGVVLFPALFYFPKFFELRTTHKTLSLGVPMDCSLIGSYLLPGLDESAAEGRLVRFLSKSITNKSTT